MSIALNNRLDFWIEHKKNVLFIGKHGVGKSTIVKEAFDKHELKWLYFSASTMDPWVDFVGVPKEKTENKLPESFEIIKNLATIDKRIARNYLAKNWHLEADDCNQILDHVLNHKQGLSYLDLVRPKTFASGEVEAIFFDEFNRSPKKVRNAVMELIQFKSINGQKFPNLKLIWAAINPEDENETYDVEKLDPAQSDRFHISLEIEYKPNEEWFRERYGTTIADAAIQWWNDLSDKDKDLVSPRRLQYALDIYAEKGNIRDVLPTSCNCSKLLNQLKNGPISLQLAELIKNRDVENAATFLQNENNFSSSLKLITQSPTLLDFFAPLFPKEKIASLMAADTVFFKYVMKNQTKVKTFKDVTKSILAAQTNNSLIKLIKKYNTENWDDLHTESI
jgi:MoxR-like ATPase